MRMGMARWIRLWPVYRQPPPPYRNAVVVIAVAIGMAAIFATSYSIVLGRATPHRITIGLVGSPAEQPALLAALILIAPVRAQPAPSAKDVMRRVEQYVASYGEKASVVVCGERYAQEASRIRAPRDFLGKRVGYRAGDVTAIIYEAMMARLGLRRMDVIEVALSNITPPFADNDVDETGVRAHIL